MLLAGRGHPAGYLVGDRAYSNSVPEKFHLPARSLDYSPVFDYKTNQLGVQGDIDGFLIVEGALYSPMLPPVLIDATKDHRAGTITDAVYQERIRERQRYAAKMKGRPDADGHVRVCCPADGDAPTAICDLKPRLKSGRRPINLPVWIEGSIQPNPPRCCTQGSLTIPPAAGAKFRQDVPFGTLAWQAIYGRHRSAIESVNAYLKDGGHHALADPMRRRIRGVAAQTVFAAVLAVAANLRMIDGFSVEEGVAAKGHNRSKAQDRLNS